MATTSLPVAQGHDESVRATTEDSKRHTERSNNRRIAGIAEIWRTGKLDKLSPAERLIAAELIQRGQIRWLLHPGQQEIYDWLKSLDSPMAVMNIARQFGKSFLMTALCIEFCLNNPRSVVWYGAPTKEQVKQIVVDNMKKLFALFPKDLLPHKSHDTWTFKNGSKMFLAGVNVNKGQRLRGTAANFVVLDECREIEDMNYLVHDIIWPMFLTTGGKLYLISTPPDSPAHPFSSKYIQQALNNGTYRHATWWDNPRIDEKTRRETLKQFPKGEDDPSYRREYLADYTIADLSNKVVPEWNAAANDNFFETWNGFPERFRPLLGMDVGYNDRTAIIVGGYDWFNGTAVILYEKILKQANTNTIGEAILELQSKLKQEYPTAANENYTAVSDVDPRLLSDLYQLYKLTIRPAYKIDKNASLNRLKANIALGKIRIHPTATNLRFQLDTGVWNRSKTDYARSEETGHLDALDALKYLNNSINWNEALTKPTQIAPGQWQHPAFRNPSGQGLSILGALDKKRA